MSRETVQQVHHASDLPSLASHCNGAGASAVLFLRINPHNAYLLALSESHLKALQELLVSRLVDWLAGRGALYRVGMDNFVLTLRDSKYVDRLTLACESLHRQFEVPFELADQRVRLGISIGGAHRAGDSITTTEQYQMALQQSAMALQHASRGYLRYAIHNSDMDHQARRYWQLCQQMEYALDHDCFRMVYQPYYNLATQSCENVEALIRLRLPELGAVPPDEFIPICEQNNLIIPLSDWIFKRCANDLRSWLTSSENATVSLNVSALSLTDPVFVDVLGRAISTHGISPRQLIIELTETMPMGELEIVLDTLESLRKQGVRIALDDFGTGYASLANLMQLPIDQIKLDRMFVSQMTRSASTSTMVCRLISMAREMGLIVVAEGVEDEQTADMLREAGCHYLQGYVIASPLEADQLRSWLRGAEA